MELKDFEQIIPTLRSKLVETACFYLSDSDEAEDVTQEVLLKLWMIRDKIQPDKGIYPLASTMTKHLCIDRLRLLKHHRNMELSDHTDRPMEQTAHTILVEKENDQWLKEALGRLSDKHRAVLHMRQVEQMETSEIAMVMGTSEAIVRTLLSRARKQMMEQLNFRRN